jgi:hypothetical protein
VRPRCRQLRRLQSNIFLNGVLLFERAIFCGAYASLTRSRGFSGEGGRSSCVGRRKNVIPSAIKSELLAKTATDALKGALQLLGCSAYACSIGADADEASGLAFAKPEAVQDTCETWRTHKGMAPTQWGRPFSK